MGHPPKNTSFGCEESEEDGDARDGIIVTMKSFFIKEDKCESR
jgi:hypothetical protein